MVVKVTVILRRCTPNQTNTCGGKKSCMASGNPFTCFSKHGASRSSQLQLAPVFGLSSAAFSAASASAFAFSSSPGCGPDGSTGSSFFCGSDFSSGSSFGDQERSKTFLSWHSNILEVGSENLV
eukprot:TRINITY_DN17032_c0_g1_i2.p3 TRINITY_DN17032_c0_g1~~TRINITY_DN17032_c0_g1_i2.p3  ORF type:complete len:124 (-),score=12.62 TRINITY_DN17032_c0_g1_i2:523-894(-)